MNEINHPLQRLFRAAAQAPRDLPLPPDFGFESRVLADWRSSWMAGDDSVLITLLRRAFLCACLMVLLSFAVNYRFLTDSAPSELAIADSAIRMSLLP